MTRHEAKRILDEIEIAIRGDNNDYRSLPALWLVTYEMNEPGFVTDLFLTRNHRTLPKFSDLPKNYVGRMPLAFSTVDQVPDITKIGWTYNTEVFDVR